MILKFLTELTIILCLTICSVATMGVAMKKLENNEKEFQKLANEKLSTKKVQF